MNRRLAKLEARKKALLGQSNSILDAADKDDREPSEDEGKTLKANEEELAIVAAGIDREVNLSGYSTPAIGGFDGDDYPGSQANASRVGPVRAAFEDDPNKGFKSPREFLTAVLQNNDRPSNEARDERLRFLATAGSDEQGAYSDPYGGFLVPVREHFKLADDGLAVAGRNGLALGHVGHTFGGHERRTRLARRRFKIG